MELKDLYEHLDLLSEYDNKPVKSRLNFERNRERSRDYER